MFPDDHNSRHRLIVVYKTAFYSFYLPVALAMLACNIPSIDGPSDPYALASSILIPLGTYFQIQDDFLDFAGTPEQIGKIGTDIVDNKCSWCINVALSLASPAQLKVLEENYGQKDSAKEAKVKAVFEEVGVREKYAGYEEGVYGELMALIGGITEGGLEGAVGAGGERLRREVFTSFLHKIYKRTK